MKKGSAPFIPDNGNNIQAFKPAEFEQQERHAFSAKIAPEEFRVLLDKLRAPMTEKIKQRPGSSLEYVEWHAVADLLDKVAPDWHYTIRTLQQFGDLVAITAAITINGVTREGVGTGLISNEYGIKKAESEALKRAARMFGVARELYKDEEEALSPRPVATLSPPPPPAVAPPSTPIPMPGERGNERSPKGGSPERPQPLFERAAERATGARDAAGFPLDPLAHSTEDLVTPRQLVAIRAIANSAGLEAEAECQRLIKCDLKEISRRTASALIEHLKARANGRG